MRRILAGGLAAAVLVMLQVTGGLSERPDPAPRVDAGELVDVGPYQYRLTGARASYSAPTRSWLVEIQLTGATTDPQSGHATSGLEVAVGGQRGVAGPGADFVAGLPERSATATVSLMNLGPEAIGDRLEVAVWDLVPNDSLTFRGARVLPEGDRWMHGPRHVVVVVPVQHPPQP